ncbi:MAG: hypothetical protein AAF891_11345 [Pseudomonadota bacterium]
MTTDNLILEHLKGLRTVVDRIESTLALHTMELRAIHARDGGLQADAASTAAAIGDLQDRMRYLEKRAGLYD